MDQRELLSRVLAQSTTGQYSTWMMMKCMHSQKDDYNTIVITQWWIHAASHTMPPYGKYTMYTTACMHWQYTMHDTWYYRTCTYTVHNTLPIHITQCTIHYPYTLHNAQYITHTHYTMHNTLPIHITQCTIHYPYTLHNAQYITHTLYQVVSLPPAKCISSVNSRSIIQATSLLLRLVLCYTSPGVKPT